MPYEKMSTKYKDERENICNKLLSIVGNEFYLCDLDNDKVKQTQIIELKPDIQKYFAVSSMSAFKPNLQDNVKREYVNIVRGILRKQGYTFESKNIYKKINNENYVKTVKYNISRQTL
jgi:hypothetical protein